MQISTSVGVDQYIRVSLRLYLPVTLNCITPTRVNALGILWQRPEPSLDILLGLILGKAVPFLKLAFELLLPPINDIEIVVREPAPLLFGSALELLPVPLIRFQSIDALLFCRRTPILSFLIRLSQV
jgi:hypothetical protein